MTMQDKIKELIPIVHEHYQQLGEWGGLPDMEEDSATGYIEMEQRTNAYLASKLDEITILAAKAMEAKRVGRTFTARPKAYHQHDKRLPMGQQEDTLEQLLARVATRTMDLMGYYGVEYEPHAAWPVKLSVEVLRVLIVEFSETATAIHDDASPSFGKWFFLSAIDGLLRIAELEKIDLAWHIEARLKYEGWIKQ